MIRLPVVIFTVLCLVSAARAQSGPPYNTDQMTTWTPGQWQYAFQQKMDWTGTAPCLLTGCAFSGKINLVPSSSAFGAGINLGSGAGPTNPSPGDVWVTPSGLYYQTTSGTVGPVGYGAGTVCFVTGCTYTGEVFFAPSTNSVAGVNLGSGTAPSAPQAGDLWITSAGLYYSPVVGEAIPVAGGLGPVVSPYAFGAKCDGSTDDTGALTSWAASAQEGQHLVVPGVCNFSSPIAFAGVSNVALTGSSRGSELNYVGAATTGNIVTFAETVSGCAVTGWTIQNLRFNSQTVMTGGDGVRINDFCDSEIQNVTVGGDLGGNANWYNGIHFNGGNSIHLRGGFFEASHWAETVNGDTSAQFTDLFQLQTKITHALIGLNIAGNVGGGFFDQTDVLENGTNVRVSQDVTAVPNLQLFFGPTFASDITTGGTGVGIDVADAGGGESIIDYRGWMATATNQCLLIESSVNQLAFSMGTGLVLNCNDGVSADGSGMIENQSTAAGVTLTFNATHFFQCCNTVGGRVGYMIKNDGAAINLQVNAVTLFNTIGNNGHINGPYTGTWSDGSNQFTNSGFNIILNAAAGDGVQMGPNGQCGLWIQSGNVIPGVATAGTPGCTLNIGNGSWPVTSFQGLSGDFRQLFSFGGNAATFSGSCATTTPQYAGNMGGFVTLSGNCTGGTIVINFTQSTTNGFNCPASDRTTNTTVTQTDTLSTTSATLTIAAGVSGDKITYGPCVGF